jgi:hypothetical protein
MEAGTACLIKSLPMGSVPSWSEDTFATILFCALELMNLKIDRVRIKNGFLLQASVQILLPGLG